MRFIQARTHVMPCIASEKARVNIRALLPDIYQTFLLYFFGPRLEYMFEGV